MTSSAILRGVFAAFRRYVARKRFDSGRYWSARYGGGGTSGAGSYGKLARFKAEVINSFVTENRVRSVIEHGCGDGNQLSLAAYPRYVGLDVAQEAISMCRERFAGDPTKQFRLAQDDTGTRADLALSLDVIFHLVEDDVFEAYMRRLFSSAERFVIIYASNRDEVTPAIHVRHRHFTRWIDERAPAWRLQARIPNRYPDRGDDLEGSFCEFFIYERRSGMQ